MISLDGNGMGDSMDNVKSLLAELKGLSIAMKTAEVIHAPLLSPHFNCFNYIKPNENKLSAIIADLLDPKGSHGQGELFFSLFLEIFDVNFNSHFDVPLNRWIVRLEESTTEIENSSRRIDIIISCGTHCIGIENKPWAIDQNMQINDYAEHLNSYDKKWCLLYLSGSNSLPGLRSITEDKRNELISEGFLKCCSYKNQIIPWLVNCEAKCRSENVRHFMKDFINYCKVDICGDSDMSNGDLVVDLILKNPSHLDAFWLIPKKEDIKAKLIVKLRKDIKVLAQAAGWELDWSEDLNLYAPYAGFGIHRQWWKNYRIGCQFAGRNLRDLCCGVYKLDETYPNLGLNVKLINEEMNKSGHFDPAWWPWQFKRAFDADWDERVEPWLEIQSGEMPNKIFATLIQLAELVDTAINANESMLVNTDVPV